MVSGYVDDRRGKESINDAKRKAGHEFGGFGGSKYGSRKDGLGHDKRRERGCTKRDD